MKITHLAAVAALAVSCFAAGALWANKTGVAPLESRIWKATDARRVSGDWGSIALYTEDGQPSVGTTSVLTAELEFLPGRQLQPPHQHADEEFQFVVEGSGTWSLNGRDYPLARGDLMYSKPWDWHGIRNSGDAPLRFVVVKFQARGVPVAPRPPGE